MLDLQECVERHEWWFDEDENGRIVINTQAPWDEPTDFDDYAGEVGFLSIEGDQIVFEWSSDNGYDEKYRFKSVKDFESFYEKFLNDGIDGVSTDL